MYLIPAKYLSNLRQVAPLSLLLLAACSSGGGDTAPPVASSFTIGGNVSGLTGTGLVLRNNGGDDLAVAADGPYTFSTPVANGGSYNVTVSTQPAGQLCSVANASGTNVAANVTNANVTCVAAFTIGGMITGAANGVGPVLQNNGGDNLLIPELFAGSGVPFTFSMRVADNGNYNVTQLSRTPIQDCSSITAASGVVAAGNVSNVMITCTATVPIPRFAYVTNGAANSISAYGIAAATGVLTAIGTAAVATGANPHAVAVEPGGRFAYVANTDADTISVYRISRTDGALTPSDANGAVVGDQPSITTGDGPFSITIHPSGKFAYVVNKGLGGAGNSISAYSIDVTTGALAAIDADGATAGSQETIATGTTPFAIVIDPTGKFGYVANEGISPSTPTGVGDISAYTIDSITGALTPIGTPVAAGTNPRSVAVSPTGHVFVANGGGSVSAFSIGPSGALTPVGVSTIPAGTAPRSVAVDPTGAYVYVANAGANSVSAYTNTNGVLTELAAGSPFAAGASPFSVNVDPSGKYVYVANGGSNDVSAFSIGAGGALTPIDADAGTLGTQNFAAGTGPNSVTTTQ